MVQPSGRPERGPSNSPVSRQTHNVPAKRSPSAAKSRTAARSRRERPPAINNTIRARSARPAFVLEAQPNPFLQFIAVRVRQCQRQGAHSQFNQTIPPNYFRRAALGPREAIAAPSFVVTSSAIARSAGLPVTWTKMAGFIASTIILFESAGSARTTTLQGSNSPISRSMLIARCAKTGLHAPKY